MSLCDSSFLKQTNMCRPSCVQVSLIAHVACRLIHRLQLSAVCDSREGELVVSVSPLIVEAVVWPCVSVTQTRPAASQELRSVRVLLRTGVSSTSSRMLRRYFHFLMKVVHRNVTWPSLQFLSSARETNTRQANKKTVFGT